MHMHVHNSYTNIHMFTFGYWDEKKNHICFVVMVITSDLTNFGVKDQLSSASSRKIKLSTPDYSHHADHIQ